MDKRRKINGQDRPFPIKLNNDENLTVDENNYDFLALSLSSYTHPPPPPPPPQPPSPPPLTDHNPSVPGASRPGRGRRNHNNRSPRKTNPVPIPFPWATDRRATVHSLNYLLSNQITTISGDVHCKKCDRHFKLELDLNEKYLEIGRFIVENKVSMHHRAAKEWQNPSLPKCRYCEQENSVRPVIAAKKREINWLFMLLSKMLGFCTLEQLKYFCKHTNNHRTGAKDRVLYLTYLALCKQLDPQGPFDPW